PEQLVAVNSQYCASSGYPQGSSRRSASGSQGTTPASVSPASVSPASVSPPSVAPPSPSPPPSPAPASGGLGQTSHRHMEQRWGTTYTLQPGSAQLVGPLAQLSTGAHSPSTQASVTSQSASVWQVPPQVPSGEQSATHWPVDANAFAPSEHALTV